MVSRRVRFDRAGADGEAELAQDFFQGTGKFAHGDAFAAQFSLEIVKDGRGGVAQHLGVEQTVAPPTSSTEIISAEQGTLSPLVS
jgi:hypothetical protein